MSLKFLQFEKVQNSATKLQNNVNVNDLMPFKFILELHIYIQLSITYDMYF
jgi:hypothetical protein